MSVFEILWLFLGLARMKNGPGLGWGPATICIVVFSFLFSFFAARAVQTSHAQAESLYPRIEKGIAAALEKLLLDERKAEPDELGVTARMSARE